MKEYAYPQVTKIGTMEEITLSNQTHGEIRHWFPFWFHERRGQFGEFNLPETS